MEKFGKRYKKTIENIQQFSGSEFKDNDQTRYAHILNTISYPDFEENPEASKAAFQKFAEEAKKLLKKSVQSYDGALFQQGMEILRLGKPKGYQKEALAQNLDHLSSLVARQLLGYEEELDLSVSYTAQNQGMHMAFRLASEEDCHATLIPLIRGTYSQVETENFDDRNVRFSSCLYGNLTVPYQDKNQEREKIQEKRSGNWLDAVLTALPENTAYRFTLKIIPMEEAALSSLYSEIDELHRVADGLMLYSEVDWNESTSTGANYNRNKSIWGNAADAVKQVAVDVDRISGNYGESFAQTRHEKNKQAELLLKQIDQRLYLLNKAIQTKAWQVVLCVEADDDITFQSICSSVSGTLKQDGYVLQWQEQPCICAMLSSEELLPLVKFPTREFAGFEFVENEDFALTSPAESGMEIGSLLWNKTAASRFYLSEKALNRHAFVCGMTGAGKTNTLFKLLETTDVPFLVIEPVKGEYRALQEHYSDLHVYSMKTDEGQNDKISILRINPFWFPEHTNIAFHIDSIKTIIASAFEMSNAMPNILEQCMYNIYINAGWNIVTGKNQYMGTIPDEFLYPTFADLLDEIEYYLDNSKFVGETLGDYHGAMTTRLKSFVNSYKGLLLNTVAHPDYSQIMMGRSVIELEGLADDADKCLVMGTILVQYFEYLKLHFSNSDKALQHVFVIEEAHRLFKNGGKATSAPREGTSANPTGQLVESLSNIMAEIRAFGEGMIIVDQSPSKVAEDVIKNSSTKIIHRVDNEKDIKLLQAALLIPNDQTSLPSLCQGEALIRTDGMRRPCKVKMDRSTIKDDYHLANSFQNSYTAADPALEDAFAAMAILSEDTIAEQIRGELWCMLMKFQARGFGDWKENMDEFILNLIQLLQTKRKYHLIDGKASIIRQLTAQSIRQMRSQSNISVGINEIGSIHLFIQRLFDFYGEVCDGTPIKEGNLELFSQYFSYNIGPLVQEYAENISLNSGSNE